MTLLDILPSLRGATRPRLDPNIWPLTTGVDEQGRHNHDIYLVNADGSNLQRLTHNGSDDVMPAWSFSEEGVIYFLSNRGGAYNVWRLKVSGAK